MAHEGYAKAEQIWKVIEVLFPAYKNHCSPPVNYEALPLRSQLDAQRRDALDAPAPHVLSSNDRQRQERAVTSFRRVLIDLRHQYQYLKVNYRDVAQREFAWNSLRQTSRQQLWPACEYLASDPFRQQLADQLLSAVEKLRPEQISAGHLAALEASLNKLGSEAIDFSDVASCEQLWRRTDVRTGPSFKEVIDQWTDLYSIEAQENADNQ